MSATAISHDTKLISKTIDNLKSQTEVLSKAVYNKIEELGNECQIALEAANNNSHVEAMVTFRLDSFAKFLANFVSKLSDDTQVQSSISESPMHSKSEEKFVSSLLDRIEKLEDSSAKLEEICASHSQTVLPQEKEKQKQEELRVNVSTLEDLTFKLVQDMSDTKEELTELSDLKKKTNELEYIVSDLQSQINSVASDEASLCADLKHARSKHKALKQQVMEAEVENDKTLKFLGKKVSNLEKLRNILNEARFRPDSRQQVRKMCEDAEKQFQAVYQSINDLRYDLGYTCRPQVGFTAQLRDSVTLPAGTYIKKMFHVITNIGDCFEPFHGHFIAPHSGLYGFCVKLELTYKIQNIVCIMIKPSNSMPEEAIQVPMFRDTPHSVVCVLGVNASDRVFVKIGSSSGPVGLANSFIFSGWSIGYI